MNYQLRRYVTALVITLGVLCCLVGCNSSESNLLPTTSISTTPLPTDNGTSQTISNQEKYKLQAEFDIFTDNLFLEYVQGDSITMNYTLAHPENYGIAEYTPTLGDYSLTSLQKNITEQESLHSTLRSYNYDILSHDQQLTYDILDYTLSLKESENDYILYNSQLSPTVGIQAQLPILLAEYKFYDKEDIHEYLKLLPCVYHYYEDIIDFENTKSKEGLFMSDESVDDIVAQCKEFIKDEDKNYLIEVFNDKINDFKLSKKETKELIESNKTAVKTYIIPAYELLIDGLEKLKGTGKNDGGLCNFPKGKDYYSYLLKTTTGSSKTPEQVNDLLDQTISTSMNNILSISLVDQEAFTKANEVTFPCSEPKEVMCYLKDKMSDDFPKLKNVNCTFKYVHKSLQDNLSPAFYLSPPIDCYSENQIYINKSDQYDLSSIFTTIAHEGLPGHLYQTVFYQQQNPSLIRTILDFGGYSEGWATYVELYSYDLAGLDKNIASLLQNNMVATLCIYGKVDLGVNYYGWNLKDTTDFLYQYGIESSSDAKTVYRSMIEEPGNYMKYILGYLEIIELRQLAMTKLGTDYTAKDFHEFFLSTGPAPFDIIQKEMTQWIDSK